MFLLLIEQPLLKVEMLDLKHKVKLTGWMTVVAPADCPKSVRNCCIIERFVASLLGVSQYIDISIYRNT